MKKWTTKISLVIALVIVGVFLVWKFWIGDSSDKKQQQTEVQFSQELGEAKIYNQAENKFTFSYPKKLIVTESVLEGIGGAKRILVESEEDKKGFEIMILPFDEGGPITAERILKDIPDMEIRNKKNILVSNNIEAISFESSDENIGNTFEIWFVHRGYLYQTRTYLEFAFVMEEILKTLEFK